MGAIVFVHGEPEPRLLDGTDPVEVHRRNIGPIEEWRASRRGGRHQRTDRWLVFRLPSWTVHVPLSARMDTAAVIDRVRPYQTEGGFVAVEVIEPITRELPMEYAVELNRLIELQMEGSVG